MSVLFEDNALTMLNEMGSRKITVVADNDSLPSENISVAHGDSSILLSIVSVVFLMLFLFMGVPAYILYSYDNGFPEIVEQVEVETVAEKTPDIYRL